MENTAIFLIHCPDRKGLVAAVSNFLYDHNANILHADQHQDSTLGLFLMRLEWDLSAFDLDLASFAQHFAPIAERFQMKWHMAQSSLCQKMAIFVSRHDHCLADLSYRYHTGEFNCELSLVISNHSDAQKLVESHSIPFYHIPMDPHNKTTAERRQMALLDEYSIDVIVLARYMQILSADFVPLYSHRLINVHHSFLPAFSCSRPYHRAHERGVKLIGATSHFVTTMSWTRDQSSSRTWYAFHIEIN